MNSVPGARTGPYIPAAPARPGLVRVCAHIPPGIVDLTGLRVLLIADLLARVTELQGLQAFTVWSFTGQAAGQQAAAAAPAATALNIHPPAASASCDGRADVHVTSAAGPAEGEESAIAVALARLPGGGSAADEPGDMLTGRDALAIRLALLSFAYHEPAELTEDTVKNAQATLGQWQSRVAVWAESPSRPIPGNIITTFRSSLEQLDTAAILAMLHTVASEGAMATGAKFETFLHADRVLGLDLASGIGRL